MQCSKKTVIRFVVFNSFAFILLASWFWQPTRFYWDNIDQIAFFWLNGSLAQHRWWQVTLAMMNFRPFDLVAFLIMITPFLIPGWVFDKQDNTKHLLTLIVLMAFLIMSRLLLSALLGIDRQSPSLVLQPAYLLHELVPYIDAKDRASGSFPGDHAAVILTWFLYMWLFAKPKYRLALVGITIIFSLPRLIGGAHWFSDDLVGGVFLALFSVAWVCYTPFGAFLCEIMSPLYNVVINRILPTRST